MAVGRSRIGLALCAAALPLLIAAMVEVGLRLANFGEDDPAIVRFDGALPDDAVLTVFDRELLFRLAPNSELLGFYRTNAAGYRGENHPAKTDSRFRILAIGDSCTFGLGVQEDATWPARLEVMLDRAFLGVIDFEVLNLGVPGYSSFQNRRQVEVETSRLHANGVVWMATGYNDALLARSGSDAELARRLESPWSRLSELRIVQMFAGKPTGFMGEGSVLAKISGGSPRVSVDEFAANVEAILAPDPSRATLSVEVFGTPLAATLAAFDPSIPERRKRLLDRLGDPSRIVDPATSFSRFGGYELFVDAVHPGAEGQQLIAEAVFWNVVRGEFLAPSPRRDWWRAVSYVSGRTLAEDDADALSGPGALPWFATLLATDAHPAAFPDAERYDPVVGTDRGEYESGRLGLVACGASDALGLDPSRAATLRRLIREHVVPEDPFDRLLFSSDDAAPPTARTLALARSLVVLRRWIGMSTLRVDRRTGSALLAADPNAALVDFDEVIALDPRAFYPRRVHAELLRKAGRVEEAKAAIESLLSERPDDAPTLAMSGMIALASGDHEAARTALEASLASDPVQVDALYGLGRIALFQGRFVDAKRRFGAVQSLHPSLFPDLAELIAKAGRGERLERVNR